MVATASTAMTVAIDPKAAPWTHDTPPAIALSAGGSVSEAAGEYMTNSVDQFSWKLNMMRDAEQASIVAAMAQFHLVSTGFRELFRLGGQPQGFEWNAGHKLVRLRTKIAGWAAFLGGLLQAATVQAQELADPAGSGVLVSAVRWLEGTLLGTIATVIAVIAVATVGLMMLTGRINWRYGATVILGCFILFGAASIVAGIQSTANLGR